MFEHMVFASHLLCNFTPRARQALRFGMLSPYVILCLITLGICLAVLQLKIDSASQIGLFEPISEHTVLGRLFIQSIDSCS